MSAHRRYDMMGNQRGTLSQIFEQALQHKNVDEMIMLLGMMPLDDISLEALSAWKNIGYDLILKIPRLSQHPQHPEFVRKHFCGACRELNTEQVQRFIPYASESDQLEGFLFVLMENINRQAVVFPKAKEHTTIYDMVRDSQDETYKNRQTIMAVLIELSHDNVLHRVSETIHLQTVGLVNQQPTTHFIWDECGQHIQKEILKRTAQAAAHERGNDTTSKRKM